jgi:hypothetical protein
VKFTPKGGTIWLEVKVDESGEEAYVIIRDSGIGVAADELGILSFTSSKLLADIVSRRQALPPLRSAAMHHYAKIRRVGHRPFARQGLGRVTGSAFRRSSYGVDFLL